MSQDDEETTKYKLNNNHKNNNNHHGPTKKIQNNQQVAPLYENFTINNNNNNNGRSTKPDHSLAEQATTKSETFNNDYRFVRNTTNAADINEQETRDTNSVTPTEYENISFSDKDTNFDKKILLQKYFRSALVGPRANIYENVCRGCNYGVFNARGPLCTFCECIVNGVGALRSDTPEGSLSNNIYENICEFCGVIYSGTNSSECKCRELEQVKREEEDNFLKVGSEELLIEKSVKEKKKVKLNKSKSFNKSNKPKIFTNLWDTLRKPKNTLSSNSGVRRPLEIIHHVEGYEQVFHTKETFDLQKICELKRSGTSCSDQHIYGRLKQSDLSVSQEEFNSTQSLTQSSNSNNKKPRISKAKFLRTQPSVSSIDTASSEFKTELTTAAATIYLNNSVCQWMTSLRREIHAYNTFINGGNEVDQDTLCYPKSIPSKNLLISSCKAPAVTNRIKNLQNFKNLLQQQLQHVSRDCGDLTEIQTLISHNSMTSIDSWELEEREKEEDLQQQPDCYQLMVEEFMANIINRQMLKTKDSKQTKQHQQIDNVKAMAGVNNNDSYTNNKNNNSINISTDIPLRQANLTSTTTTMTAHNHNSNNRHKRQGMYLRLEDHQQLQQHAGEEQFNLHNNNKVNNYDHNVYQLQSVIPGERVKIALENNNENENPNSLYKTKTEHNTVTTPDTSVTALNEELNFASRAAKSPINGWDLIITEKRRGIHERNVLEAFEALLEQERTNQLTLVNEEQLELDSKPITTQESQKCEKVENKEEPSSPLSSLQLQTFGDNPQSISQHFPTQILDVIQLINQQQLSIGLNTSIICYDKYLKVFLQFIYQTNNKTRTIAYKIPNKQLVRKFKQFYNYCEKTATSTAITTATTTKKPETTMRELTCVSSNLKLDLNITNSYNCAQNTAENYHESLMQKSVTANVLKTDKCTSVLNKSQNNKEKQKVKTPPQVPKRDPKTRLSPTAEVKRFALNMTVPANTLKTETENSAPKEEESIYQPIWKFETKGKVAERYQTDDDYYDLKALKEKIKQESPNSEIPKILISDDILIEEEEDHNNWEPDEEFVFTKQKRSLSLTSDRNSTIRSNLSLNSSIGTSSSLSGSTITEFASSTATLASAISCSLRHHWYRNIGIFYSLTEPKLRAIIYDYDRVHSSRYFAKPKEQVNNDSGLGKSLSPIPPSKLRYVKNSSSNCSSASTSASSSPVSPTKREILDKSLCGASESVKYAGARAKVVPPPSSTSSLFEQNITSSVLAWKRQLLDVNCMEDEEDMIVSECEIKRAQQIKEDIDQSPDTQPQQFIQRFKSRSTDNLDLPNEDDKKTIGERLANMYTRFSPIQRGILNIRSSPKGDKKVYKRNRASQSTSLYLEDGLKPKPPIFGAPLHQLELQQNVPRFVVDTVDYIERKDRIIQDGLYRACGNKFSIDELKLKLTKSYIYDSKLIVADDIHTVTSLLKQFFRDLPEPIIPQDIYNRITVNLADKESIDTIRIAIEEMKEPNKSTLRFLIKHLTNVAACSSSNRMNASNMAIVWGPSLFALNDTYDMIGRMNTLTKVLIENYDRIFDTNERLL
ncbi:uncharacterized protein LOC111684892 isoform X1 [Lucilia cuprina]|uniref:uncharacterized protein LOC111684892 isoform X1 n=1 Tax=Lucilia cuprina TaxID=7375 RepID=UPI001F05CD63|nr:uncharacterized protein LOC111684892 isoform X1 [Lucilia cuprina]XP_046803399.1 uncharacterized protein LOC111684892 isoform X1 [Lucilia cuprina]XP_046803400.1 uncharacterized protein LOC111684892 isoform X1 [Lucilia cuprina]XP_046803401.1 uncharacterized protein LOC111684892 isoform X1 [Lucilia cuprina]